MIENVIRAALVALYPEGVAASIEENGSIIVPPHLWAEAETVARAVIEAIREPTEAMTVAGDAAVADAYTVPAEVWRAMVDAVLKNSC